MGHSDASFLASLKRVLALLKDRSLRLFLVHNKASHRVRVGSLHCCARCLGTNLTLLMSYMVLLPVWYLMGHFHMDPIWHFTVSILLAVPAILDWSLSKLRLKRGSNRHRVVTGALLGIGLAVYLSPIAVLPALNLLVVFILNLVIIFPVRCYVRRRDNGPTLREMARGLSRRLSSARAGKAGLASEEV